MSKDKDKSPVEPPQQWKYAFGTLLLGTSLIFGVAEVKTFAVYHDTQFANVIRWLSIVSGLVSYGLLQQQTMKYLRENWLSEIANNFCRGFIVYAMIDIANRIN